MSKNNGTKLPLITKEEMKKHDKQNLVARKVIFGMLDREAETLMFYVLQAMDIYGGSFVKQLAVLYRLGDPINKAKLYKTFNTYFKQYAKMSDKIPRE